MIIDVIKALLLCRRYDKFSRTLDEFDSNLGKKNPKGTYVDMMKVSASVSKLVRGIR